MKRLKQIDFFHHLNTAYRKSLKYKELVSCLAALTCFAWWGYHAQELDDKLLFIVAGSVYIAYDLSPTSTHSPTSPVPAVVRHYKQRIRKNKRS